jgi:hypothetical protein
MKANILQHNTKRAAAILLIFWLSGVVFLFCCETSKAKASEAESCPLSKTNHCNKKSNEEIVSQLPSFQTENHIIDCCLFPSQVFDKARKLETNHPAAFAAVVKTPAVKFFLVERKFVSSKIYYSLILNCESRYLKNCVFRI